MTFRLYVEEADDVDNKVSRRKRAVFLKRVHVYISGRVQGVFFRAKTQSTAKSFNLAGWARNMADGRVEAVFEGDDADIDKMLAWCHSGPRTARVEEVVVNEEPCTGIFHDFSIKY